jgi:hypothetical protein
MELAPELRVARARAHLQGSQRAAARSAQEPQVRQRAALEPPASEHAVRELEWARAECSPCSTAESELPSAPRAVLQTPPEEPPHRSVQPVWAKVESPHEADWCRAVEFP